MNCKTCLNMLPDLLMDPESQTAVAARAHLATCSACASELAGLERTFALLDLWEAPEVSPYFDQKLAVRLREEVQAAPASWFERMRDRLRFGTGRQLRPALVAVFALAVIAAGSEIGVNTLTHTHPLHLSATVTDLQILDNNEQAIQQEDQILQESMAEPPQSIQPQS